MILKRYLLYLYLLCKMINKHKSEISFQKKSFSKDLELRRNEVVSLLQWIYCVLSTGMTLLKTFLLCSCLIEGIHVM